MNRIDYNIIRDAAQEIGSYGANTIRTDYSGRGMYGRECFGIVVDSVAELLDFWTGIVIEDEWTAGQLARDAREDGMGQRTIVYFPGWQLDNAQDDEEEGAA